LAGRSGFLEKASSPWGLLFSWGVVAFGHPILSPWLAVLSSVIGYAVFWAIAGRFRRPFWVATGWFALVQAVQIAWLASPTYMGNFIYAVYGILCLGLGLQFGALTHLLQRPLSTRACVLLAGFWALLEWSRLFVFTGFPWNPAGLALSAHSQTILLASLIGSSGLSFWVFFTNLLGLRLLEAPAQLANWAFWIGAAMFPFLYGLGYQNAAPYRSEGAIQVALLQTGLRPEQKDLTPRRESAFVPPLEQWERIAMLLATAEADQFDLIVMPEGTAPWGARRPLYPGAEFEKRWALHFKNQASQVAVRMSNLDWVQNLAHQYQAEVIAGFLDADRGKSYNAAFHLSAQGKNAERYEKRMLVPVGEYVPLRWVPGLAEWIFSRFAIGDAFVAGSQSKVFSGKRAIGIAICSEEAYGELMRETRRRGANLFVSISNDAWFPGPLLPQLHWEHARLRAVENGVFVLRSTCTGVTGAIDCFGRPVAQLSAGATQPGILPMKIETGQIATPYIFWGDVPILALGWTAVGWLGIRWIRKKKLPEYTTLD
jgi:apolipoprotein N-acyltransferase